VIFSANVVSRTKKEPKYKRPRRPSFLFSLLLDALHRAFFYVSTFFSTRPLSPLLPVYSVRDPRKQNRKKRYQQTVMLLRDKTPKQTAHVGITGSFLSSKANGAVVVHVGTLLIFGFWVVAACVLLSAIAAWSAGGLPDARPGTPYPLPVVSWAASSEPSRTLLNAALIAALPVVGCALVLLYFKHTLLATAAMQENRTNKAIAIFGAVALSALPISTQVPYTGSYHAAHVGAVSVSFTLLVVWAIMTHLLLSEWVRHSFDNARSTTTNQDKQLRQASHERGWCTYYGLRVLSLLLMVVVGVGTFCAGVLAEDSLSPAEDRKLRKSDIVFRANYLWLPVGEYVFFIVLLLFAFCMTRAYRGVQLTILRPEPFPRETSPHVSLQGIDAETLAYGDCPVSRPTMSPPYLHPFLGCNRGRYRLAGPVQHVRVGRFVRVSSYIILLSMITAMVAAAVHTRANYRPVDVQGLPVLSDISTSDPARIVLVALLIINLPLVTMNGFLLLIHFYHTVMYLHHLDNPQSKHIDRPRDICARQRAVSAWVFVMSVLTAASLQLPYHRGPALSPLPGSTTYHNVHLVLLTIGVCGALAGALLLVFGWYTLATKNYHWKSIKPGITTITQMLRSLLCAGLLGIGVAVINYITITSDKNEDISKTVAFVIGPALQLGGLSAVAYFVHLVGSGFGLLEFVVQG
jgi:hypothetical protein